MLAISMLAEVSGFLPYVGLAIVAGLAMGVGYAAWRVRAAQRNAPAEAGPAQPQKAAPHAELDAVRAQQTQTLSDLRARIAAVQAQRDKAMAERERLMKGLAEIGGHDEGVTIAITSAKALTERARELGQHDNAVGVHDAELGQLQQELSAAEQLLAEVDAQRNALNQQVQEQSHELWKLRAEIEATQRKSHEQRARTMMMTRSNVRKTEVVANRLEDQLKHWVRKNGEISVNWSQHGHANVVAEAFAKLDRDFVDRYFSHATNPEYDRGQRRTIRVKPGKDAEGDHGELVIVLDDDAGRTLGLRYELKKGAPDAAFVGFVLAMYLRALSRELRDYEISA